MARSLPLLVLLLMIQAAANSAAACDRPAYTEPHDWLEQVDHVIVATATSPTELRRELDLVGRSPEQIRFEGTDCDPELVQGHRYVLFVGQRGRFFYTTADDAGIEVPARTPLHRTAVEQFRRWRTATDRQRRARVLSAWLSGQDPLLRGLASGILLVALPWRRDLSAIECTAFTRAIDSATVRPGYQTERLRRQRLRQCPPH